MKKYTKKQAEQIFKSEILPGIIKDSESDGIKDYPARSLGWSMFIDSLCKDGLISQNQYNKWSTPKFCLK